LRILWGSHGDEVVQVVFGGGGEEVEIHQGVSGGVGEDGGAVAIEQVGQAGEVADAADFGVEEHAGVGGAEFLLQVQEGRSGGVEANDGEGLEAGDLAADLGPEGTGGGGDEDDHSLEAGADGGVAGRDIRDINVAGPEVEDEGVKDAGEHSGLPLYTILAADERG